MKNILTIVSFVLVSCTTQEPAPQTTSTTVTVDTVTITSDSTNVSTCAEDGGVGGGKNVDAGK